MKAHKQDDTQTRLALLEQSHSYIISSLNEIKSEIGGVKLEIKDLRRDIGDRLNNIDKKIGDVDKKHYNILFYILTAMVGLISGFISRFFNII